jgi:hypothetical protein
MGGSDEEKHDHPTQKPVELMRRPILNHLKRGEAVYDPFLGSGTTLAAAELTERVCCGLELDPKYVDVIVQRWEGLSGKKAILDGEGRTLNEIASERERDRVSNRIGTCSILPEKTTVESEGAVLTDGGSNAGRHCNRETISDEF